MRWLCRFGFEQCGQSFVAAVKKVACPAGCTLWFQVVVDGWMPTGAVWSIVLSFMVSLVQLATQKMT